MRLAGKVMRMSSSSTLKIKTKVKKLKEQGKDIIDFGSGIPDFGTPMKVRKAAQEMLRRDTLGYTGVGGDPDLKRAIVQKYMDEYGVAYNEEEIIISCGAKQALFNLALSLFDEGDEVIIPAPYWVSYPEQIRLVGARPIILPTRREEGFRLKADEVKNRISAKTKAIIITSPSNPAGAIIERDDLRKVMDLARQRDFHVIFDECYERFTFEKEHISAAEFGKEKVVLVNSFSKTYALPTWRVGFALGPKELIEAMAKLQSHSTSYPASIAQRAALTALTETHEEMQNMNSMYRQRRDLMVDTLNSISGISCHSPEGNLNVFPNISAYITGEIKDSIDFADFLLEEISVATVPGQAFGCDGHIRMSFSIPQEQIDRGLERMRGFLSTLPRI